MSDRIVLKRSAFGKKSKPQPFSLVALITIERFHHTHEEFRRITIVVCLVWYDIFWRNRINVLFVRRIFVIR